MRSFLIASLLAVLLCACTTRTQQLLTHENWVIQKIDIEKSFDFNDTDKEYALAYDYIKAQLPSRLSGKGSRGPVNMRIVITRARLTNIISADDQTPIAGHVLLGVGRFFVGPSNHKLEAEIYLKNATSGATIALLSNKISSKEQFISWKESDYNSFFDDFLNELIKKLYTYNQRKR